jgi:aspartate/tyrosine/aromatic aminotransferase
MVSLLESLSLQYKTEIEKEKERMTRMQKQLLNEVEQEKKKGWSIFG